MTGVLIRGGDQDTDVPCREGRPHEDPVRKQPSVNQGEKPQKKPTW